MRSGLASILCVISLLAGCGGVDGGTTPPPTSNNPPPAPPPVIGTAGGTVTEASGASVIVPAGALTTNTTIRVAKDSTGAPALPAGLTGAGNIYIVTPHGGDFAQPVEVRIPAPTTTLLPNQEYKLAKAQPGGEWEIITNSAVTEGTLSGKVASFIAVRPNLSYHMVSVHEGNGSLVSGIHAINNGSVRINGGYFIFKKRIFDYIREREELVSEPFQRLIDEEQLVGYKYDGFWAGMDTFKDKQQLESLWGSGAAPWEVWKKNGGEVIALPEPEAKAYSEQVKSVLPGILNANAAIKADFDVLSTAAQRLN